MAREVSAARAVCRGDAEHHRDAVCLPHVRGWPMAAPLNAPHNCVCTHAQNSLAPTFAQLLLVS